jgi:hypothetical protein
MNSIAEAMIKDINVLLAASLPPFRESKTWHNGVWTVDARYGFRRIENVAREHVLSIANVTVAKPLRGIACSMIRGCSLSRLIGFTSSRFNIAWVTT